MFDTKERKKMLYTKRKRVGHSNTIYNTRDESETSIIAHTFMGRIMSVNVPN